MGVLKKCVSCCGGEHGGPPPGCPSAPQSPQSCHWASPKFLFTMYLVNEGTGSGSRGRGWESTSGLLTLWAGLL